MKHRTFLTGDSPEFGHTWTARCHIDHGHRQWAPCPWTADRLDLGHASEAGLRHEADTAEKVQAS